MLLLLLISLGVSSAFRNEIPLRVRRPVLSAARHRLEATSHGQEEGSARKSDDTSVNWSSLPRRSLVQASLGTLGISSASLLWNTPPARARGGLVRFPCTEPLGNTYHFLRVGETLLEQDNVLATNPLFLTNREAALSPEGVAQVQAACESLKDEGVVPTVVRYSFAAACQDTARILGDELHVGQDRLIPEFFFLDPRGVGQWDRLPLEATEAAVWSLDVDEAGTDGADGRPPANDDSTPHETLGDHAVRLRQLFSACETVYSGDTVVLIFPDGTGPALLSCMIAGIPFNRVHELELQPGELRRNVNRESTLALLKERQAPRWQGPYQAKIAKGREESERLLSIDFRQPQEESQEEEVAQQQQAEEPKASRMEQPGAVAAGSAPNKRKKDLPSKGPKVDNTPPAVVPSKATTSTKAMIAATKPESPAKSQPPKTVVQTDNDSPPSLLQESLPLGVVGLVGALVAVANDPAKQEDATGRKPAQQEASASTDSSQAASVQGIMADQKKEPGLPASELEALSMDLGPIVEEATAASGAAEKEKRLAAAHQAMDEYLQEDDGGDAWLHSLTDIIAEDDAQP